MSVMKISSLVGLALPFFLTACGGEANPDGSVAASGSSSSSSGGGSTTSTSTGTGSGGAGGAGGTGGAGGAGGAGTGGSGGTACQPGINEGLIAHYPFDGDVSDTSGNMHHGTAMGNVVFGAGRHGSAAFFGDRWTMVSVPDDAQLDTDDAFTISAWINQTGSHDPGDRVQQQIIVQKWWSHPVVGDYFVWVDAEEKFRFAVANKEPEYTVDILESAPLVERNVWAHVGVTFDGGNMNVFFNGSLVASKSSPVTHTALAEYDDDDIIIGNGGYERDYWWIGGIDDVRLYNRALSADEIAALAHDCE